MFQRGPGVELTRFALNIDHVTISTLAVESAICVVQSFVRDFLLTQRDFFTDNGISMLLSAENVAGSVCEGSTNDPWNCVLPERYNAVVQQLKKAYDVVVVRRKDARDTSER